MADVKISELPSLTTPDGSEEIPVNDSGSTKNIRIDDLFAGDNVKAKFGASDDLEIYHDGINSVVRDAGTGELRLAGTNLRLTNSDQTKTYLSGTDGGDTRLAYDNAYKLFTTSTGVDVTGTVTADGLTVVKSGDSASFTNGVDADFVIKCNSGVTTLTPTTGTLAFGTSNTERARIDSSGNLLVGKTADDLTTQGTRIRPHSLQTSRDSEVAFHVNRNTSDGDLARFYKDGTTVGSIGAAAGNSYFAGTSKGLTFGSANMYPCNNTGTKVDNAVDIGSSSYRFQDAYLSGGVYLGGTGAANKLDDYETGTWTPSCPHLTLSNVVGSYTKVGRAVYIGGRFTLPASGSGTNVLIEGLPFTSIGGNDNRGGISVGHQTYSNTDDFSILMLNANTKFNLYSGSNILSYSEASGVDVWFGGWYTTNS